LATHRRNANQIALNARASGGRFAPEAVARGDDVALLQQARCGSPVRSEDVGDVVAAAAGADVAGEDALVLVAGGSGDLGWVVAVAGGLGGISGAE
jgi:hypothetical protein